MVGIKASFNRPANGSLLLRRQCDDLVAFVQHASGAHNHLFADFGELHVPRLTLHQLDAEILLELFELRGQRGLAHERAFRRPAEMPGVGERHQVFEILFRIHTIDVLYQIDEFNQYQSMTHCGILNAVLSPNLFEEIHVSDQF